MTVKTDVVIIGAGPVGLFAVFECGMLRLKTHVIDTLADAGGQCTALYPEKPIYDIPAHPAISGADLIDNLMRQAAPFNPVFHFGEQVMQLTRTDAETWKITTSKGTELEAPVVIVAAGCGAFGPNRPPLEGLEAYEATGGVQYFVQRREAFRGKKICIAGGGDSAVDWAISLSEVAERVQVVHRRPKFRAAPESAAKLDQLAKDGKIEMIIPYQLAGLEGANGQLSGVIVETLDGQRRTLEADHLLPFFGLAMTLGPIADWGLNLERNQIATTQANSATSAPGIFAVGDIATYPGKLKLILSGFAEAASAAHAAHAIVHPGEALHFEYSTSKGVPGAA